MHLDTIVKTVRDIEGIRETSRALAHIHEQLATYIEPGMTTKDLDNIARAIITSYGAISAIENHDKFNFPGAICTSVNEIVSHGIPSSTIRLNEGDKINIDIAIEMDGYVSDASRTYLVGNEENFSNEDMEIIRVARECLSATLLQIEAGLTVQDLFNINYQHLANYFGKYELIPDYCLGHGVGINLHEGPILSYNNPNLVLQQNMVIAIEPHISFTNTELSCSNTECQEMYTNDSSLTAVFEETVLVTDCGCEVLTSI